MIRFFSLLKSSVVALCVIAAGVAFSPTSVHAGGLTATTYPVTNVTANSATLNGFVTYTGGNYNTVFAVGTKPDLSDPVFTYDRESWANMTLYIRMSTHDLRPTGSAEQSFDFNWWTPTGSGSELQPSTTYYVRSGVQTGPDTLECIYTHNCYNWGSIVSFTTRAAILPAAVTGNATAIGATTANIDGVVTANDAGVSAFVEYGTASNLSEGTLSEFGKASDRMDNCYGTDCERVRAGTTPNTITRSLANLEPETTYYYRVVARNPYGTTRGEIKSFMTTPPVGLTINNGASYATSKNVTLSISWPVGATAMAISNDGGFRAGTTTNSPLRSSVDWTLDQSIQGMYPKIVYVRFSGPGIDLSRSYTDDIILDSTAPVISTSSAEISEGLIAVSLAARDDESGLSKVELSNGALSVSADYSTRLLVRASDLGLGVSAASVKAASVGVSSLKNLKIQVSDRAGNRSSWTSIGVPSSGVVDGPPVEKAPSDSAALTPGVSLSPVVAAVTPETGLSHVAVARIGKIKVPRGAKLSVRVTPKSAQVCKATHVSIVAIKTGVCAVKVTVKPKKGKAVVKTVTLTMVK